MKNTNHGRAFFTTEAHRGKHRGNRVITSVSCAVKNSEVVNREKLIVPGASEFVWNNQQREAFLPQRRTEVSTEETEHQTLDEEHQPWQSIFYHRFLTTEAHRGKHRESEEQ